MTVSISSDLNQEPLVLRNTDPYHLFPSIITAMEGLVTQSETHLKLEFIELETGIKIKLSGILNNWTKDTIE